MVRRSFLTAALGMASALLLAGCDAAFSALRLAIPKTGYRIVPDQAYGADPRQKLDI